MRLAEALDDRSGGANNCVCILCAKYFGSVLWAPQTGLRVNAISIRMLMYACRRFSSMQRAKASFSLTTWHLWNNYSSSAFDFSLSLEPHSIVKAKETAFSSPIPLSHISILYWKALPIFSEALSSSKTKRLRQAHYRRDYVAKSYSLWIALIKPTICSDSTAFEENCVRKLCQRFCWYFWMEKWICFAMSLSEFSIDLRKRISATFINDLFHRSQSKFSHQNNWKRQPNKRIRVCNGPVRSISHRSRKISSISSTTFVCYRPKNPFEQQHFHFW